MPGLVGHECLFWGMLCGPSFLKPNMIEDEKLKTMGPTRQTKMNEAAPGMVLEIDVAFPVRN